ncbi:MAG: filamentous hemagglutinin N-terminal domain-containing protein, partial [Cyanobacteria bacterium J06649_11]
MINLLKLKLILLICGFLTVNNTPAIAQITPDNTLGAESSRVLPNGNIDKIIDGGALRDRNLFHSFQEFNINNRQSVYFSNPSGIENILTRVTGGNASNILGTLGVDGAANLFLINPKGIVFGENARLDVNGSFVGTTASGLQFGEQGNFSATNPQAPPLLTVNITPGLQYGNNHPSRTIKNTGNLTVGKDLTLYAGSLDLQGRLEAEGNLTLQATDTVK